MAGPLQAARAAIAADHAHADRALWITRRPDAEILAEAAALEAEGQRGRRFWGVPFAVKDNIDVAGLPTTAGCPDFAYTPTDSAAVVQRLVAAGGVVMGKTNLDQFATGLVGVRSPYGVPRHVFDAALVPGGSSSGSAVAVAAGIVPFALGTDTAGSGRVPAAFGNIVGLKPTIGSVSARGMVPACRSLDTISVFAGSVGVAMAVLEMMVGFDAADPYSRVAPPGHLRCGALPPVLRVGMAGAAFCEAPEAAGLARAGALLGAVDVDISPMLDIARLLYDGPWVAERSAALRGIVMARPEALHPVTRGILLGGLERRSVDAFDAFHRLAGVRRHVQAMFARIDALLLPTAPFCPSLAALDADPIGPNARLGCFTNFVNLCDLAAIAVPAGFAPDGHPVGVTLIGPAWSEGRLAAIADHLHRAATGRVGATEMPLPPPAPAHELAGDEVGLFCIGAHMSGLALNGQVTALGGRFVRAARTLPEYRLFALGARPGLLRVAPGAAPGAAVDGEVWALPRAAIGALLCQVPPPLCFGTVALEDGPCLGFLAEAGGLGEAPDISAHGGWRAWLAGAPA